MAEEWESSSFLTELIAYINGSSTGKKVAGDNLRIIDNATFYNLTLGHLLRELIKKGNKRLAICKNKRSLGSTAKFRS